jgi:F0F1-type ATP synthase epsilon subunit
MGFPMPDPLRLRVMTPTETLLDVSDATHVSIHLADGGSIGLRPGHASLLAETVAGKLIYFLAETEHSFEAQAGILFVEGGTVTIFTSGSGEYVVDDPGSVRFDRLASELLNRIGPKSGNISENNG